LLRVGDRVAQPNLRKLQEPVAVLAPDRLVEDTRGLAERKVTQEPVDVDGRGRHPRTDPSLRRAQVLRIRQLAPRVRGDSRGSSTVDEPRRVPQLVGEVARVLELLVAELLVVAWRGAIDQRETECIRAGDGDGLEGIDDVALRLGHPLPV